MELPIRPELIADEAIKDNFEEYIVKINSYIKTNIRYSDNGPWCCFLVSDISAYITPFEKSLTNKILKEIIPLYEKMGWNVYDEIQSAGGRYLTFTSKIWEEKCQEN